MTLILWRYWKGLNFRANNEPTEENLEKSERNFTVDIILVFVIILDRFILGFFF